MLDFSLIMMNNLIIPLIDFLSIISIILAVLRGLIWPLIIQIILFSTLQILINLFTLQLAGERDISLVFLPLFAIGYKQFHEILMLKCFFDVIIARARGKSFSWTFIERRGLEEPRLRAGPRF
jgi:biofilm PGA synthesis N-glycosyltransferase PgaC